MKKALLILLPLALVAAFLFPACQSNGGKLVEEAVSAATARIVETEKRIEDRLAILIARVEAGELTDAELKEEASAAVKQEKELAQADVAAILEQVKKDLKDEANDWGSRAIGGLGEAIGTYGSSGSIWAALASLAGSIFYAKSKAERLAMQTQIARDAKYLPGGPFAVQVAPMQQAFAAAPTAPAYQVPAGYRLVPNVTGSLAPLDKA